MKPPDRHRIVIGACTAFLWLLCFSQAQAQSFEEGISLYQQENYKNAAAIFSNLKEPKASLFAAKSFYALGNYSRAKSHLNTITESAPPFLYYEAMYTSALIDYQREEFGEALNKLYAIFNVNTENSIGRDAKELYQQIMGYLTGPQRTHTMEITAEDKIKFQLLKSALGKVSYSSLQTLFDSFYNAVDDDEWIKKAENLQEQLANESAYKIEYGPTLHQFVPPEGTVYNIGVILPKFQPDEDAFDVVRSIYFGAMLAAKAYNSDHIDSKVYIRFADTKSSDTDLESIIPPFADSLTIDAIIGPLFSEQAQAMVALSNQLKIPVIPPLANANIHPNDSFLFQANPTFAMHGEKTASYAVNDLGLHTFAVIAQQNSKGASSARAFKETAEALGAQIVYSFVGDISAIDYGMAQHTKRIQSSEPPIDAVYAPFTGASSLTLIDLLLEDIKAMKQDSLKRRDITVLGSQKWESMDFTTAGYNDLDIYYSLGGYSNSGRALVQFKNNYRTQFNFQPNKYAMIGYDIASFLFMALDKVGNPALLKSTLLKQPLYKGLVKNIKFKGSHVNQGVKIMEVTGRGQPVVQH